MSIFDSADISIPCPNCGRKTKKNIRWIKSHRQFICPGCGNKIALNAEKFKVQIAKAERSIQDLIKRINKA